MAIINWTGLGGTTAASDSGNWDSSAPIAGDTPVFPTGVGGVCDWDITAKMNSIDTDSGSLVTVTQSTDVDSEGQFRARGAGMSWDTAGYDVYAGSVSNSNTSMIWDPATTLYIQDGAFPSSTFIKDSGNTLPDVTVTRIGQTSLLPNVAIGGTLTFDSTGGAQTFLATDTINHDIYKIATIGPNITHIGDAGATQITVTDATGVNEYSDWENITIIGGPIECNDSTCSDLGGNTGITFLGITKYFRGLVDSKWSNDLNWSTTSGGVNDTTKATGADDAIMEASVHVDTTEACKSFTQTANYSPTFDGALNVIGAFTVSDINGLEGTGTINVQGDFSYTDAASQGNTIIFTLDGTGDQDFNFSGSASAITFDLRINKISGTVNNIANMNASNTGVARCRLTVTSGTFNGGAFDCKFYSLDIDGGSYNGGSARNEITEVLTQTGGVFTATSGVTEISGSGTPWLRTGGTFNNNGGQVELTRTGSAQDISNYDVAIFYDLRIAKTVWDTNIIVTKIQVTNSLIIDNSTTSSSPELTGTIELTGTAKIIQNGNLYGSNGVVTFAGTDHEWVQNNTSSAAQMPPIKMVATNLTLTEGTVGNVFGMPSLRFESGDIINAETVAFANNRGFTHVFFYLHKTLSVGSLIIKPNNFDFTVQDDTGLGPADLIVLGDMLVNGVGSGTQFFGVGSTLELRGDFTITGIFNTNSQSTLNVLFNGTIDQNISMPDSGVNKIPTNLLEVDKAAGKLTLLDTDIIQSVTGSDIIFTSGEVDLNGFNITADGDLTTRSDFSDLAGSTIQVNGNFDALGSNLEGTSGWNLEVYGTSEARLSTISNCNATTGEDLIAYGSTDGGGNASVIFLALRKFWISAIAGVASNNALWSLYSGGANDTTAPASDEDAEFDDNGTGACDWDLPNINGVIIQDGYDAAVTQSTDVYFSGSITNNDTGLGQWNVLAFDLVIDGNVTANVNGSGGVIASSSSNWYLGGNIDIAYGIPLGINPTITFWHSQATPSVSKTHTVSHSGNNDNWNTNIVYENQTMQPKSTWIMNTITWGVGTTLSPDAVSRQLQINGVWVNTTNCFVQSINAPMSFLVRASDFDSGNYGETNIEFGGTVTNQLTGSYTTTGTVLFRRSSDGTTQTNIKAGASIDCAVLGIGNVFTSLRGYIVNMEAGSSVNVTGDLDLYADNGTETTAIIVASGSTVTVGNDLTVETGAGISLLAGSVLSVAGIYSTVATSVIDMQNGSVFNMSSDLVVPNPTSTIEYKGTINAGIGGTTFNFSNPDNSSRINILTLADGCTCVSSGTCYTDTLQGPATGTAFITGDGSFQIIDDLQTYNRINFAGDVDGGISLVLGFNNLTSEDFGNTTVRFSVSGPNTVTGTDDFICYDLDVWKTSQNETVLITISGAISTTITNKIFIGGTVTTRGGQLTYDATGVLTTGEIEVKTNDAIQTTGLTIGANAGNVNIGSGGLTVAARATFTVLSASITICTDGPATVAVGAVGDWGGATLKLIGANAQPLEFGGSGEPVSVITSKTAGIVDFVDGPLQGVTRITTEAINGSSYDIELPNADAISIDTILGSGSGTGKAIVRSDVSGTQVDIMLSRSGTVFHCDFKDTNFTNGIIFADIKTCSDLGGNTLSNGVTDGIYFYDIQYQVDNIYKTNRVTAVTVKRRGQSVPAITLSDLYTADDWAIQMTFTDNGGLIDLSDVSSISAVIVSDGNEALTPTVMQSDATTGADWSIGQVVVAFPEVVTSAIVPARNAWIEVQVTESTGLVYTFPREQIRIVKGVIA